MNDYFDEQGRECNREQVKIALNEKIKNIENLEGNAYLKLMEDRREAFWEAGYDFEIDKECKACDGLNNYLCLSCEIDQLMKKGY